MKTKYESKTQCVLAWLCVSTFHVTSSRRCLVCAITFSPRPLPFHPPKTLTFFFSTQPPCAPCPVNETNKHTPCFPDRCPRIRPLYSLLQAPARLQQLNDGTSSGEGVDALMVATGNSTSDAEFAFGRGSSLRAPPRRTSPFSFAPANPAKRSRSRRDEGSDALALAPGNGDCEAGDDGPETFQFSMDSRHRHAAGRPRRRAKGKGAGIAPGKAGADESAVAPLLAVAGADTFGSGGGGGRGDPGTSSGAPASRAPITNGFDMSKFRKPGEWKCQSCLVMNPPGGVKCLSCETPKAGGAEVGGGGGGGSVSGGLLSTGASTSSMFTFGSAPSGGASEGKSARPSSFTFGAPAAAAGGSGAASGSASAAPSAGAGAGAGASASPVTNGFDMTKFRKPGEWKCEACFVKNPPGSNKCLSCETVKPGASAAAPAAGGGSAFGGAGGGASGAAPSFTFGGQPAVTPAVSTASFSASAFGAVPTAALAGTAGQVTTSVNPTGSGGFTFGAQPAATAGGGDSGGGGGGGGGGGAVGTAGGASAASIPISNGFDMSKFTKPGEWKCQSCLVKNGPSVSTCLSCETPKPAGASFSSGGAASGGSLFGFDRAGAAGASATGGPSSSLPGGFRFGTDPAGSAAPAGGGSALATPSAFESTRRDDLLASASAAVARGGHFAPDFLDQPPAVVLASSPTSGPASLSPTSVPGFGFSFSGGTASGPAAPAAPVSASDTAGGAAGASAFGFRFGAPPSAAAAAPHMPAVVAPTVGVSHEASFDAAAAAAAGGGGGGGNSLFGAGSDPRVFNGPPAVSGLVSGPSAVPGLFGGPPAASASTGGGSTRAPAFTFGGGGSLPVPGGNGNANGAAGGSLFGTTPFGGGVTSNPGRSLFTFGAGGGGGGSAAGAVPNPVPASLFGTGGDGAGAGAPPSSSTIPGSSSSAAPLFTFGQNPPPPPSN